MATTLPPEIWLSIILLATDEDILSAPTPFPTSFSTSAWFSTTIPIQKPSEYEDNEEDSEEEEEINWDLRSPEDAYDALMRRSYATKKSMMLTCRLLERICVEERVMTRTVFVNQLSQLIRVAEQFDRVPGLGWQTRRVHITCPISAVPSSSGSPGDFENAVLSILKSSPNLATLVIKTPLVGGSMFGRIAHGLGSSCKRTLKVLRMATSASNTKRLIWMLTSLRGLQALSLDFSPGKRDTDAQQDGPQEGSSDWVVVQDEDPESTALGTASTVPLALPSLTQLTLTGILQPLLTHLTEHWALPLLHTVTLSSNFSRDVLDLPSFARAHGPRLVYLDVNSMREWDVSSVLDSCGRLQVLCLNADLQYGSRQDGILPYLLTQRFHENITHVGLHGLEYAFTTTSAFRSPKHTLSFSKSNSAQPSTSVDLAFSDSEDDDSAEEPIPRLGGDAHAMILRHRNDRLFTALFPSMPTGVDIRPAYAAFPNLHTLRALSRPLIQSLGILGGPDHEEGYERWKRWWDATVRFAPTERSIAPGVRFENCTGDIITTVPGDDAELSGSEDGEDSLEEELEEMGFFDSEEEQEAMPLPSSRVSELRDLLEECRLSAEEGRKAGHLLGLGGQLSLLAGLGPQTGHDPKAIEVMVNQHMRAKESRTASGTGPSLAAAPIPARPASIAYQPTHAPTPKPALVSAPRLPAGGGPSRIPVPAKRITSTSKSRTLPSAPQTRAARSPPAEEEEYIPENETTEERTARRRRKRISDVAIGLGYRNGYVPGIGYSRQVSGGYEGRVSLGGGGRVSLGGAGEDGERRRSKGKGRVSDASVQ
ncbi:hypothetical protein BDV98DRAFT_605057 [Pterulicium gracile]|uniref:Uncharacterized protein n=1 Tax=Pterulicium gracile TaxID=1884261 RepID=A0A5C3QK89_9AGAR|nr:hypothetical protein BDV98DRAFT_605057 [Pterula gracilis]